MHHTPGTVYLLSPCNKADSTSDSVILLILSPLSVAIAHWCYCCCCCCCHCCCSFVLALIGLCYFGVSILGFRAFGTAVNENVLLSFASSGPRHWVVTMASMMVVIHVAAAYQVRVCVWGGAVRSATMNLNLLPEC